MVRRNAAREQAVAAAKAQRRREGQKLSRLRGQGIDVSGLGSGLRGASFESMSVRQIRAATARSARFTSRSTQFVAGFKGVPLDARSWRAYKRAERAYNAKSASFYESVKDLTIPTLNQTVSQYLKNLRDGNENAYSRRDGDYRSFGHLERNTALGITSQENLERLVRNMERRASPGYLEQEARLQRRIVRQMLERTGNQDLIPRIRQMDDAELITLTQYTEFMDKLSNSYDAAKSTSSARPRGQSDVLETNEEDIRTLMDWAHTPETADQDTDDSRTTRTRRAPERDRYGRFVRSGESNPDPHFARDERGRFARRTP